MRNQTSRLMYRSSEAESLLCRLAMKESKGRMNPAVMNKLLAEKLKG